MPSPAQQTGSGATTTVGDCSYGQCTCSDNGGLYDSRFAIHVPGPPTCILREVFGYDQFRNDQSAVVDWVTQGGDALVLMPTGAVNLCATKSRPLRASAWPGHDGRGVP